MVTTLLRNARRVFDTFRRGKAMLTCRSKSMLERNFARLFADLTNTLAHAEVAWTELTRPGHTFLRELLMMLATINMVEPQTRRFGARCC